MRDTPPHHFVLSEMAEHDGKVINKVINVGYARTVFIVPDREVFEVASTAQETLRAFEYVDVRYQLSRTKDPYDMAAVYEQFIDILIRDIEAGRSIKLADTIAFDIDQFIKAGIAVPKLLFERSRILAAQGRWATALDDLRSAMAYDTVHCPYLLQTGTMLVTLGRHAEARAALLRVMRAASNPHLEPSLVVPSGRFPRMELWHRAAQMICWIDDYQGRYDQLERNSSRLAVVGRDLGAPYLAGVLHRLGRSRVERARANGDQKLAQSGLRMLKRSKALTPGGGNAFQELWAYRGSDAAGLKEAETAWLAAKERTTGLHGTMRAHIHLLEGRRLASKGNYLKAWEQLEQALRIWRDVAPYPKGAHDALLELAVIFYHQDLPFSESAMRHLLMARVLASRMRLPTADRLEPLYRAYIERYAISRSYLRSLANEVQTQPPLSLLQEFARHGG